MFPSSSHRIRHPDSGLLHVDSSDEEEDYWNEIDNKDDDIPDWMEEEENDHLLLVNDDADDESITNGFFFLPTSSSSKTTMMETFDYELAALIFMHLSLSEIVRIALVSKSFYAASRSNAVWKKLFAQRWNVENRNHPYILHNNHRNNNNSACKEDTATNTICFYKEYQKAHSHPHDLWITHWNCVYPCDAITPGRCGIVSHPNNNNNKPSIPLTTTTKRQRDTNTNTTMLDCCEYCSICPNCRIGRASKKQIVCIRSKDDDNTQKNNTLAREMRKATMACQTRLLGHNNNPSSSLSSTLLPPTPCHAQARNAFSMASTFHRRLSIRQYTTTPTSFTNFLTDVLFFNLTDPATADGQWEIRQLLRETRSTTSSSSSSSSSRPMVVVTETSHHSWHIIQLTNPNYYRPIVFHIAISRPDCFTAYPSEGYVLPGESVFVTLGVRPLGSVLAYAFDALNIFRDGLDAEWSDVYTEEAHLPMAPFLFRYHFGLIQPVHTMKQNNDNHDGGGINDDLVSVEEEHRRRSFQDNTAIFAPSTVRSGREATLEYHRQLPVPAHQVRSLYLSAHVHAHYSFAEFLVATCIPWDTERDGRGPIYSSPILKEDHPTVYDALQNLNHPRAAAAADDDDDLFRINPLHTDGPCLHCQKRWGCREEELGQAYIIAMYENARQKHLRQVQMSNIVKILRLINKSGLSGEASRLSLLLYVACCIVQTYRGSPWLTMKQKQQLVCLEARLNEIYHQIPAGENNWVPWRISGVFRNPLCTQSVFSASNQTDVNETLHECQAMEEWKDEPDYLDAFQHLAHTPGRFCLGPQEDPNHLEETVVASSPRYFRPQKGHMTDTFMDHPISALQAGICVISDPRALLVHGVFDVLPYPGTLVRRPKVSLPGGQSSAWSVFHYRESENLISYCMKADNKRLAYLCLQNGLDLQDIVAKSSLRVALPELDAQSEYKQFFLHYSFYGYLRGMPLPGIGRFPLSRVLCNGDSERVVFEAVDLECTVNESPNRMQSSARDNATDGGNLGDPRLRQINELNHPPRLFHLMWLLGARLGLVVTDNDDPSAVFVERNILIASQWVSLSFMAQPLFFTLLARFFNIIPSEPIEYKLQDLTFILINKMRFLSAEECGGFALVLLVIWLGLARWAERNTYRDYFRVMMEHVSPPHGFWERLSLRCQRQWDAICPLFVQRRVFAPKWNIRSRKDFLKHMAYWKSQNLESQHLAVHVKSIKLENDAMFGDSRDDGIDTWRDSSARKILMGAIVLVGSFASSSPHFWLNLVTVFSCSISLGMSVSLHAIEKGRLETALVGRTSSILQSFSVVTIVILAFLIGQLVGSSCGAMFLAEFIVTSISLLIGGAGTISTRSLESWGCLFCLSSTAFWGYLLGRVAVMVSSKYLQKQYLMLQTTS
jgi:hypothetical protein